MNGKFWMLNILAVGLSALVMAAAKNPSVIRLEGPESGIALFKQGHTEYVSTSDGLEVQARLENINGPLYLSLDVTDPAFVDGAAPLVEFRFDYFDEGNSELTFDIDSSDPLYGSHAQPGVWRGAGGVQFMDSGTWKTKTMVLADTRFSGRLNGADFRFRVMKHPELRLRNISLKKLTAAPITPSKLRQGKVPNILVVVFDDLNDYVGAEVCHENTGGDSRD